MKDVARAVFPLASAVLALLALTSDSRVFFISVDLNSLMAATSHGEYFN